MLVLPLIITVIIVITVIVFFSISIFLIIRLLNSLNKIILYKNKIKYEINDSAKFKFKVFGEIMNIGDIPKNNKLILFYCTTKWSIKNNNYIKYIQNTESNGNVKYCIIDAGYYYYIDYTNYTNEIEIIINNNSNIIFLDIIKYSTKVKIIS